MTHNTLASSTISSQHNSHKYLTSSPEQHSYSPAAPPTQAQHYWETLPLPPQACCSHCVSWTCGSEAWCLTPCLGSTRPLQHHPRNMQGRLHTTGRRSCTHWPKLVYFIIHQNNTDLKDKFKCFASDLNQQPWSSNELTNIKVQLCHHLCKFVIVLLFQMCSCF